MSRYIEKHVFTRRQFIKGTGVLFISAVVTGIFAKLGINASAAQDEYIAKRAAGLYSLDESMTIRRSHENPEIIQIYKEFLSPGEVKPLTEKSEHLLHTRYGQAAAELAEELKKSQHAA